MPCQRAIHEKIVTKRWLLSPQNMFIRSEQPHCWMQI